MSWCIHQLVREMIERSRLVDWFDPMNGKVDRLVLPILVPQERNCLSVSLRRIAAKCWVTSKLRQK